ncbi:hypothetical protein HDU81_003011 [Chytriomyces hyalinus]|nr:hypothetical protein HDU81_003011 [Chytriomyces hyalinus]
MATIALVLLSAAAQAQFFQGGETEPGLPSGCVGSYPNITMCREKNWYLGDTVDICKPLIPYPLPGQQVYIKDAINFCINLPNPDSIFLKNNYYSKGLRPTVVQAEGFVQAFCSGPYLPPGAKPFPVGAIRSAHVMKNFTVPGQTYYQIHGTMDCDVLNINCTQSFPGAYDDGGQYDDGPFISCGKEPYSGVDNSTSGNLGFKHYVEMAGNGLFCMRVCEPGTLVEGGACDVTHDTEGCEKFMRVKFTSGFDYVDLATPTAVTTFSVSLPPLPSPTAMPSGGGGSGGGGGGGGAPVNTVNPSNKSGARSRTWWSCFSAVFVFLFAMYLV